MGFGLRGLRARHDRRTDECGGGGRGKECSTHPGLTCGRTGSRQRRRTVGPSSPCSSPQSSRSVATMPTSLNPTSSNAAINSASGRAPAIQPVHRSMSRVALSESARRIVMSAICARPPGRSTRRISSTARGLSGTRFRTPFEITTSTLPASTGRIGGVAESHLDVGEAARGRTRRRDREHVGRHIDPDGAPTATDMSCGESRSVPAPQPMSRTVTPVGIGAILCGLPTPANEAVTSAGSEAEIRCVVPEARGGVVRPPMEMKAPIGRDGDAAVDGLHFLSQSLRIETDGARSGMGCLRIPKVAPSAAFVQ